MTPETILSIAIGGGAIALALIALAMRLRRNERAARAQPDAEAAAPEPEPPAEAEAPPPAPEAAPPVDVQPPLAEPAPAEAPAPARPGEPAEVVRVLRDPDGGLLVEMDGKRYQAVNEIKDQKHGLDLVDAVMDLQKFLGLDLVASLAAKEAAAAAPPPTPSPLEPLQRPSINPIKQMMILRDRELKKSREKAEAGPQPGSIVEEIEAILVKRLIGSPYDGRSIHMRPGLHGGAHIDVDGRAYESIEDVEDEEVKQFLKSVISEWEEQR